MQPSAHTGSITSHTAPTPSYPSKVTASFYPNEIAHSATSASVTTAYPSSYTPSYNGPAAQTPTILPTIATGPTPVLTVARSNHNPTPQIPEYLLRPLEKGIYVCQ